MELFDVEKDPHQLNNLAEDPDLLPVLRQMRTAFSSSGSVRPRTRVFCPSRPRAHRRVPSSSTFVQLTEGKYNVDDYGVYDIPASPKFVKLLQ